MQEEIRNEKEIEDLPPSTDDFWEYSEVELRDMRNERKHDHNFKLVTTNEIKCECGVGSLS